MPARPESTWTPSAIRLLGSLLIGALLVPAGSRATDLPAPVAIDTIRIAHPTGRTFPLERYSRIVVLDHRPEVVLGEEGPQWVGYASGADSTPRPISLRPGGSLAEEFRTALRAMASLDPLPSHPSAALDNPRPSSSTAGTTAIVLIHKFRIASWKRIELEFDIAWGESNGRGDTLFRDALSGTAVAPAVRGDRASVLAGSVVEATLSSIACRERTDRITCRGMVDHRLRELASGGPSSWPETIKDVAVSTAVLTAVTATMLGAFFLLSEAGLFSMPALH